jgi:hypothetical protein
MSRSTNEIQSDIGYHKKLLQQIRAKELSESYCTHEKEMEVLDKLGELQDELSDAMGLS